MLYDLWNMLLKYGSWKLQLESWNTNHESLNWTLSRKAIFELAINMVPSDKFFNYILKNKKLWSNVKLCNRQSIYDAHIWYQPRNGEF